MMDETDSHADVGAAVEELLCTASTRYGFADHSFSLGVPFPPILHDDRGAPYLLGADGLEDRNLLVSKTDEEAAVLIAWIRPEQGSPVVGFGIDLVALDGFEGKHGAFFVKHLLSEQDLRFLPEISSSGPTASAYAFSAKEAAFKACSQPLRAWIDAYGEGFYFEARGFELADATHEQGTARKGEAQAAMDALGIAQIELLRAPAGNLLVTAAFALAR
ncbi:MAG TPA: 4'-phosphopantetheinyl transferase superfamily protein [Atopobiaceae bacterium]|nr:4'-phosphopantetheinyl transferase superfamily protein [Atopobiaceae bacterium]